MKKKLLAIVMMLILIFAIAGCSEDVNSTSGVTDQVSVETVEENVSADAEEVTASDQDADGQAVIYDQDTDIQEDDTQNTVTYTFRNDKLLNQHYEKHGIDMGFESPEDYEAAASAVVNNPDALHKTEQEDGDDIYYIEDTNEFVVVSTDGYLRTYFYPDAGKSYYDRQ